MDQLNPHLHGEKPSTQDPTARKIWRGIKNHLTSIGGMPPERKLSKVGKEKDLKRKERITGMQIAKCRGKTLKERQ